MGHLAWQSCACCVLKRLGLAVAEVNFLINMRKSLYNAVATVLTNPFSYKKSEWGFQNPFRSVGICELLGMGKSDYFCLFSSFYIVSCPLTHTSMWGHPVSVCWLNALLPTVSGFLCFAYFLSCCCSSEVRLGGWFITNEWERKGSTDWSIPWVWWGLRPNTSEISLTIHLWFTFRNILFLLEFLSMLVQTEGGWVQMLGGKLKQAWVWWQQPNRDPNNLEEGNPKAVRGCLHCGPWEGQKMMVPWL